MFFVYFPPFLTSQNAFPHSRKGLGSGFGSCHHPDAFISGLTWAADDMPKSCDHFPPLSCHLVVHGSPGIIAAVSGLPRPESFSPPPFILFIIKIVPDQLVPPKRHHATGKSLRIGCPFH